MPSGRSDSGARDMTAGRGESGLRIHSRRGSNAATTARSSCGRVRELPPYPQRLADSLEYWAREAPDRVLVARRDAGGAWRQCDLFADAGARPAPGRRAAHAQSVRRTAHRHPLGQQHRALTLGAGSNVGGIPYAPYRRPTRWFRATWQKLRYVMDLLTPGLVAAFGTPVRACVVVFRRMWRSSVTRSCPTGRCQRSNR